MFAEINSVLRGIVEMKVQVHSPTYFYELRLHGGFCPQKESHRLISALIPEVLLPLDMYSISMSLDVIASIANTPQSQ